MSSSDLALLSDEGGLADAQHRDGAEQERGGESGRIGGRDESDGDEDGDEDEEYNIDTIPVLDEQTLFLLSRGDAALTSLRVNFSYHRGGLDARSVDWRTIGRGGVFARNASLRKLIVERALWNDDPRGVFDEEWASGAFYDALATNKSVRDLFVDGCPAGGAGDIFASLAPFFERNEELRAFGAANLDLDSQSAEAFAAALSGCSTLRKFELLYSSGMGDGSIATVIGALGRIRSLRKLSLVGVALEPHEKKWPTALANLLQESPLALTEVNLGQNLIGDDGADILARALVGNCTLKKLSLKGNKSFTSDGWRAFSKCLETTGSMIEVLDLSKNRIDDEGLSALAMALADNVTLKELDVSQIKPISTAGWSTIANFLRESSSLKKLSLRHNAIGDLGASALADALVHNVALKSLDLSHMSRITSSGWVAISKCIRGPNSTLERIDLSQSRIDDRGKSALASAFASNSSLRELDVTCTRTVGNTLRWHMAAMLQNPNCALEGLGLGYCELDNEEARALAAALSVNTTLKCLNLGGNRLITSGGWLGLFSQLRNPESVLQELRLSQNNLNDDAVSAMVQALGRIRSLKILQITGNISISPRGRREFSSLLSSDRSALEEFIIDGYIDDEFMKCYANALTSNSSLRKLEVWNIDSISIQGWAALTRALWNRSSIKSVCESNHMLEVVSRHDNDLPDGLSFFLKLNRLRNKNTVARRKVILHLSDGCGDIRTLLSIDLSVFPYLIASADSDSCGWSVLYLLFQSAPFLFDQCKRAKLDHLGL